jgi:hypothetical protein
MPTIRTDNQITRALAFAGASLATAAVTGAAATGAGAATLASSPPFAHAGSSAPVPSPGLLTSGDRGAAVKQLQRALHIGVTGLFGDGTHNAVVRFQRGHGLRADGVVGPQTRNALDLKVKVIPSPSSASSSSSAGAGGYSIPASIVMCESGGNYSAVNSSSGAGGAYQILPSTWAAYGGTGAPQDAPPAEQNAIAAKIYASGGASQWSC